MTLQKIISMVLLMLSFWTSQLHAHKPLIKTLTYNNFFKEKKRTPACPYAVEYTDMYSNLIFLGSCHDSNLHSNTFKMVQHLIALEPDLVILEGFSSDKISEGDFCDYASSCAANNFHYCAENAYAGHLCCTHKIAFIGGEPSDLELWNTAKDADIFMEDFVGFYLVRQIPQWKAEIKAGTPFEDFAHPFIQNTLDSINATKDFTLENFYAWYRKVTGKALKLDSISECTVTCGKHALFTTIHNVLNAKRDTHLYTLIAEKLMIHQKVLVIYGHSHLEVHEQYWPKVLKTGRIFYIDD